MKRFSLRVRLLLITIALLVTGLGAGSAIVADQLDGYLRDRLDTELRSMARLLALGPVPSQNQRQNPSDPASLALGLDLFGSPYIAVLDDHGTLVSDVRSPKLPAAQIPRLAELRRAKPDGAVVTVPAADGSGRWRVVAVPHTRDGLTIVTAGSYAEIDAAVSRVRTSSLIAGLALLAALTVVGWFAVRAGLWPLRRIEQTAAAVAEGELSRRVPELAPPGTEVGRLSSSLNTMLGQLEQAFAARAESEARMRRFVGDVSHELRTPLFGIKGSTELYRMGALPERADVDETMSRIEREATRLAALTDDLLLLAQLDEDQQVIQPEPMDLRTLAIDARHDLRALDPARLVELTGPGGGPPAPAPVRGDEARLRQVVTNLVGNAVAHTPPGTPVRVGVGTADGRAVLEVADQGPGMTAEQASRVFDRFYRADRSRNRSDGAGAGLGLAIVRSLVAAHGGEVELSTALGEGACFRLSLPLLTDASVDR